MKPRYTLAELLAQCDFDRPITDEDREWLDAHPVGREWRKEMITEKDETHMVERINAVTSAISIEETRMVELTFVVEGKMVNYLISRELAGAMIGSLGSVLAGGSSPSIVNDFR